MDLATKEYAAADLLPIIKEIIQSGGAFELLVTGTSMTPTLKHKRSQVRLVSPEIRHIDNHEIVLFQRDDGNVILHRIVKVLPDNMLLINGDAQNWCESIRRNQVIAVVSAINRGGVWISCDQLKYRCGIGVWCILRPVRGTIFRVMRIIGKVRKRLFSHD